MKTKTLLPAIRSRVGDWNYYVTTLSFSEIAKLIKAPDEIHERKGLSDWIQREAIESHAKAISKYIIETPQRFLGSLIVGVYGGSPDWSPLTVKFPGHENIEQELTERIEGTLGLLHLTGEEKLFPIDGQHRVAGIKAALKDSNESISIREDSVSAIFVAHNPNTQEGIARTRRLFTTVNKKAKIISKSQIIALDEDNGFAIVTRQLIDTYKLFSDEYGRVLYSSSGSIPSNEIRAITSVVGLFELVRDLYGGSARSFERERPSEEELDQHLQLCTCFIDTLVNTIPALKLVLVDGVGQPGAYRTHENNHLLFRPIGQRAFARSVQLLMKRGLTIEKAIKSIGSVDLNLLSDCWRHILWNPVTQTMMSGTLAVAEAQLLRLAKHKTRGSSSEKKLDKILSSA